MYNGKALFFYDRDSGNQANKHRRREAVRSVLLAGIPRDSVNSPDWLKDFGGAEGALTTAEKYGFDAYILHLFADGYSSVVDSLILGAADRNQPLAIGIIGPPSSVEPELKRITDISAEFGVECRTCCLPSENNGYMNSKTLAEQSGRALKQLIGV